MTAAPALVRREISDSVIQRAVLRVKVRHLLAQRAVTAPAPVRNEDQDRELELLRGPDGFLHFLKYWQFKSGETGQILSFWEMWPGQARAAQAMVEHRWLFLLKAGKLGFTELECAYDAWTALFTQQNVTIGLFSRDNTAAKVLLSKVRFGLRHLPAWMSMPVFAGPGGETTTSIILAAGADDLRTIISYSTRKTVAIDVTLNHAHLDELSHVNDPKTLWDDCSTIIPPTGSIHVVTRGRGQGVYTSDLWLQCSNNGGASQLFAHFEPWSARSDRDEDWFRTESGKRSHQAQLYYAPSTAEEALAGDDENEFVPVGAWDMCSEPDLPPLTADSREQVVLGVDAGITGDLFAISVVTRHPTRHSDVALRQTYVIIPKEQEGGRVDLNEREDFLRVLCRGGCPQGHPRPTKHRPLEADCPDCAAGHYSQGLNVVCLSYDKYQLEFMMDRLNEDRVAWCEPFDQSSARLISDANLRNLIVSRRIAHRDDLIVRKAIGAAAVQVSKGEDTRMRIVKRGNGKIDPLVSLSMAVEQCLYLNL